MDNIEISYQNRERYIKNNKKSIYFPNSFQHELRLIQNTFIFVSGQHTCPIFCTVNMIVTVEFLK